MKIYENIIIGNFLYSLGYAICSRHKAGSLPSVINLLQQSPADALLGDLLVEFPGVVRLIEFKIEENRSNKEKDRHSKLSSAIKLNPKYEALSRRMHWYVETGVSENKSIAARIVPYLDAFPREQKRESLEIFIENLAEEVVNGYAIDTDVAAKEYLRWVKRTQGDGTVGSGGILLVANSDGSLHYAHLLDLLELRFEHRLWLEHCKQREQRSIKDIHRVSSPQKRLTLGRGV